MTSADPGRAASKRRPARLIALAAVVLALVGAVLIVVAVRTSRPGAPQPAAAAAGSIDPYANSSASIAASPSTSSPPPVSTSQTAAPATPSPAPKSSTAPRAGSAPKPTTPVAPSTTARPTTVTHPAPAPKGPILPGSIPVSLSIPALGVTSSLLQLGLNPDGSVAVPDLNDPDSKAGWYKYSPTPGSMGPAIILGHIDSAKYGPGVFYHLGDLQPGNLINITRGDGTVAVFRVDGVRSYPKNDFPTPTVYGNLDYAGLRLITCGGVFDPDAHSYESNIVAFASLVSSHRA